MSECDPTESSDPAVDTGAAPVPLSDSDFHSSEPSNVLTDRTGMGFGLAANPGGAVRISDSRESVLTELETDGSGEETLLLPCLTGSSSSPRRARQKRSRRNRLSSSSDKDTSASPGRVFFFPPEREGR